MLFSQSGYNQPKFTSAVPINAKRCRIMFTIYEYMTEVFAELKFWTAAFQILVSYQKIMSATEDAGVMRAIGTTYFADGYFR